MLGIFVSTFARHEGHVLPFIPLIILPSVFLTGLIIDIDALPGWAAFIGKCLPLHYAVNIIHEIIKPEYSLHNTYLDFAILTGYIFLLWILASLTLKESEWFCVSCSKRIKLLNFVDTTAYPMLELRTGCIQTCRWRFPGKFILSYSPL